MTIGTRAQVWHGTAQKTSGGLTRADLFVGKDGAIKSKAQAAAGKKNPGLKMWRASVDQAKKQLGIRVFKVIVRLLNLDLVINVTIRDTISPD